MISDHHPTTKDDEGNTAMPPISPARRKSIDEDDERIGSSLQACDPTQDRQEPMTATCERRNEQHNRHRTPARTTRRRQCSGNVMTRANMRVFLREQKETISSDEGYRVESCKVELLHLDPGWQPKLRRHRRHRRHERPDRRNARRKRVIGPAHSPPSSVSRSNRLRPRPASSALSLVMTGGSCLWSPINAKCSLCCM